MLLNQEQAGEVKEQRADEMAERRENADVASGRETDNTDPGGWGWGGGG